MRLIRTLAFLTLLCSSTTSWSQWPPANLAEEIGLPTSTDGGVEIRVWLGGGVTIPESLYRIVESKGIVRVERLAWAELHQEEEGLSTAKDAARDNAQNRRFLNRHVCGNTLKETAHYFWCQEPLKSTGDGRWSVVFKDLLPEELWNLPDNIDRNCGWTEFDGEAVGIDILSGTRHHSVVYFNPDFCCPNVACAIANHVRRVVEENIR